MTLKISYTVATQNFKECFSFSFSLSCALALCVCVTECFFCWCPGFTDSNKFNLFRSHTHTHMHSTESNEKWNKRGRNRNRVRKVRNFYHVLTFFSIATNFALLTRLLKWVYSVHTVCVLQYIHKTHMFVYPSVYRWDAAGRMFLQRMFCTQKLHQSCSVWLVPKKVSIHRMSHMRILGQKTYFCSDLIDRCAMSNRSTYTKISLAIESVTRLYCQFISTPLFVNLNLIFRIFFCAQFSTVSAIEYDY